MNKQFSYRTSLLWALVTATSLAQAQSFEFKSRVPELVVSTATTPGVPEVPEVPVAPVALVQVAPGALSFGSVVVGQSKDLSVSVSNVGTANAALGSQPAVAGSATYSVVSNTCAATLAPGQTCTVTVRYLPTGVAAHNATLTFAFSQPAVLQLSGAGVNTEAEAGSWELPQKTYGDASFELSPPDAKGAGAWTYSSSNEAVVSVSGALASIGGAGSAVLTATQAAYGTDPARTITATLVVKKATPAIGALEAPVISAGSRYVLEQPSSEGTGSWTFSVTNPSVAYIDGAELVGLAQGSTSLKATQAESSNYLGAQVTAAVQVLPAAQVQMSLAGSLSTRQGELSPPVTVTVTNVSSQSWTLGSSALTVSSTGSRFKLETNTCRNTTLAVGASCTAAVRIVGYNTTGAPATPGTYKGTLVFSTSAQAASLPVTGTVVFRDKITLPGGAARPNWTDGFPALCKYQYGSTYGGTQAQYYCAGSSSFTYVDNKADCDLCGKYLDKVSVSTSNLAFGTRDVGSSNSAQVALLNSENFPVQVNSVSTTGSASFSATHNCAALSPAGSCQAQVTFTPVNESSVSGKLQFTANTEGSPYYVSLSGKGQYLAVTRGALSVPAKTFGDGPFPLVAPTSTSPGAWSYSSSNTGVATVAGDTVTITGAGTTTLTATQAASGAYASGSVTATLTVAKATPVLPAWGPFEVVVGSSLTLTPPASSSTGAWAYVSGNSLMAITSANLLTGAAAGTTTVTATQAATANYTSASAIAQVTVTPAGPAASVWCKDILLANPGSPTGIYTLSHEGQSFDAYCEMETDGGGWTMMFYGSHSLSTSATMTVRNTIVKGYPLVTRTENVASFPVLPSGVTNNFNQFLFKGGNSVWQQQKGTWVRGSMFAYTTGTLPVTYQGVLTQNGSTTAFHSEGGGWGTTVDLTRAFSLWPMLGKTTNTVCGGSGQAGPKNCPYFGYSTSAYHYDFVTMKQLFVR